MILSNIRQLATAGILCGALTAATIGGAFAAPNVGDLTPAVTTTTAANPVGTPAGARGTHSGQGVRALIASLFQPVAQLFNITPAALRQQLASGQSLAQIATQYGKTATDVENAMMTALQTRLDKAVANGKLTSTQEQTILSNASSRIDKLANANLAPAIKRLEARRTARGKGGLPSQSTPTAATGS